MSKKPMIVLIGYVSVTVTRGRGSSNPKILQTLYVRVHKARHNFNARFLQRRLRAMQIARKDDLGDSVARMRGLFGPGEFDFHPVTFVFPR